MSKIEHSEPADWLVGEYEDLFCLKSNLNVKITRAEPWDMVMNELWAQKFPSKDARRVDYQVWYGSTPVEKFIFATVDGQRADLPVPRFGTMMITPLQLAIAQIVNCAGDMPGHYFRDYIRRFTTVRLAA